MNTLKSAPMQVRFLRSCNRFRVLVLVFISAGLLTACRKTTNKDLIGSWHVDYSNSKLSLNLNQDGTFEQIFQLKGDPNVVRRTGKWKLKELEGESVDFARGQNAWHISFPSKRRSEPILREESSLENSCPKRSVSCPTNLVRFTPI